MPMLSAEDLRSALDQACLWITRSLRNFSLDNASGEIDQLLLFKPLGELVLTATLLNQIDAKDDCAEGWLAWAWDDFGCGRRLVDVLVARPDLIVLASLYANFHENDFRSDELMLAIEYIAQSDTCNAIELPNWRRLDVDLALEKLGFREFPVNPEYATWLANMPEPWILSNDISYCITHEVFYITDFGQARERLKPEIKFFISLWLPAWLRNLPIKV